MDIKLTKKKKVMLDIFLKIEKKFFEHNTIAKEINKFNIIKKK